MTGKNSRKNEIEVASSILHYDREEMQEFFPIYESLEADANIIIDGFFHTFVTYVRNYMKELKDKEDIDRNKLINYISLSNSIITNKDNREKFEIWFSQVQETDVPLNLASELIDRFVWENYKASIENIDKSEISFSEKLRVRPKIVNKIKNDGIINLSEIEISSQKDGFIYTTGLSSLDHIISLTKTNFVIIAARPGVGKSLFMLMQAIENARRGVKSLVISLEMNQVSLGNRIANYVAEDNIKEEYTDEDGNIDHDGYEIEFKRIQNTPAFKKISKNLQLYVSDSSSADVILDNIEKHIKEDGYEAIFIDYLQLLQYPGLNEFASLRALTKELKNMAFRNSVLIVTGSQVSRQSTETGLYLSDLFGSSTIEADADVVIGLENKEDRRQSAKTMINVKALKNREGPQGSIKYLVDYSTGRLEEYDESQI